MRNISLDILKVVLAFFVFGIHIQLLAQSHPLIGYYLTDGLFRLAVPVFIIINGFFLARVVGTEKLAGFIRRLLVLYALWMLIYAPWWVDVHHLLRTLITALFGCYHLWYLPAVILSALMLNVVHKWPPAAGIALALMLFAGGLILQARVDLTSAGLAFEDKLFRLSLYRNFLFDGFPFLYAGFLIGKHVKSISRRLARGGPLIAILPGLFGLLIGESYLNFRLFGPQASNDLMMASIPLGGLLFLIFTMKINIQGNSRSIATFSGAFYFSHLLCIIECRKLLLLFGDGALKYHLPLSFTCAVILSLALVKLKSRYPALALIP